MNINPTLADPTAHPAPSPKQQPSATERQGCSGTAGLPGLSLGFEVYLNLPKPDFLAGSENRPQHGIHRDPTKE